MQITPFAQLIKSESFIGLAFSKPHRTLSSAVLNGGFQIADQILNLRVGGHDTCLESPKSTLQKYADNQGWTGTTVGLMTSASMATLRIASKKIEDIELVVWVTSGLSNLRRVGDRADYTNVDCAPSNTGTINLGLISSVNFSDSAMAEALMILTEAKVAAVYDADLKSPISNLHATGTGTDSTVVATLGEGPSVEYCGKHVVIGQAIGELAYKAISSSFIYGDGKRFERQINAKQI